MIRQYALRRGNKSIKRALTFGAFSVGASLFPYMQAYALDNNALPAGGTVVGGNASFDYSAPGQLHVTQNTARAVINWDSFNIGQDALTQFHQLSSSSVVVNRVTGNGDPTQILGSLSANGIVMVLDRNGVVFGQNSRVDVGGIVVSTGELDTTRFIAGDQTVSLSNIADTKIINEGTITVAEAGIAAFVAPTVINNGLIEARLGSVSLAAGTAATLDLYGDGLVEIAVDEKLESAVLSNSGTINAQGGRVAITVAVAKDVVDNVINMSGIVNASSAEEKGGKIILGGGNIEVSGTLDASGKTGGGEIEIGGGYQGSGDTIHAQNTYISSAAVIKANTTGTDGDGGKVIVWSDGSTQFDGIIEAKSGIVSGDGGLVETSGKINLGVSGAVDASSVNGAYGEWLLDPQNVEISGAGLNSIPGGGGVYSPNGALNPFTVLDSSISAALSAGNNVTITTVNPGQAQSGAITLNNATILKSGGGTATLTLKADARVHTAGTNSISSNTGALNLVLWSNADNTNDDGRMNLTNTTINTNGGEFFAGAGLDDGANTLDGYGDIAYDGTAADGRPDGLAFQTNDDGIILNNTSINTGDGNITMLGRGGSAAADFLLGLSITDTSLQTSTGNVNLVGIGGSASANQGNRGVILSNSTITATDTGSITLNGTGGAGTDKNYGVLVDTGSVITAKDGAVNLIGYSNLSSGTGNSGVLVKDSSVLSNGSSHSTFKATRGDGTAPALEFTGTSSIGGASATGNQTFITNTINVAAPVRTTGITTIKPITASTSLGIGGGAGTLNLLDTELSQFSVGTLIIGDSALGTGDMIIDSWDLSTKAFNVELYANDISILDTDATVGKDAINLGTGNFMTHAMDNAAIDVGSLSITGLISKNQATDSLLDLRADQAISITAGGATNMITAAGAGKLNVVVNADRDNDNLGNIIISNANITTNGGNLTLGGGLNPLTDYAYGYSGTFHGINLTNDNINLAGGTFTAHGRGDEVTAGFDKVGIIASFTRIATTVGDIVMNGYGGIATSQSRGLSLGSGGSAALVTTSGAISLTGISQGTGGTLNYGVSGSIPITTTSGIVDITGTGVLGSNGINLSSTANTMTMGSGNVTLTSLTGDLYLNMGINKTAGASANLLLRSHGNISLDQYGDINSTSNALNVALNSDRDANSNGAISLSNSTIVTNGGYFVAGGGSGTLGGTNGILGDGDGTGADDSYAYGNTSFDFDGILLSGSSVTTNAGAIILRGHGSNGAGDFFEGVAIRSSSLLRTTTGQINIKGQGGINAGANSGYKGVTIGASLIETNGGNITIKGTGGGGTGPNNMGIELYSSADLHTLGAGTINLEGTGSNGTNADGLRIADAGTSVIAESGAISLKGIGAGSSATGVDGVLIASSDVTVEAKGAGHITIDASTPVTGTTNYGLRIIGNNGVVRQSGGGNINITAATTNGIDSFVSVNSVVSTSGGAGTGTITFNTNTFDIDSTSSVTAAGNLTIKPRTASRNINLGGGAGGLDISDAELARLSAATLIMGDSVSGTGDIDIDSWDLSAKTHHVQLFGNDIDLGGITTGAGNVYLYAKNGDITVSADSSSNGAGHLNLLAGEDAFINEDILNAGTGRVNIFAGWDSTSAITTNALFDTDDVGLDITDRDIMLGTNGRISSGGTGTSVLLVATDDFKNNSTYGVSAISAAGGRYLVYSENPTDTIKGGLTAQSLFNLDYETDLPSTIAGTNSRFLFEYQDIPTLPAETDDTVNVTSTIHYETTLDQVVKQKMQDVAADDERGLTAEAKSANCLVKDNTGLCLIN